MYVGKKFCRSTKFLSKLPKMFEGKCFYLQSTSYSANHHLMELLIVIDVLRRASAKTITAVMPYFGYASKIAKLLNLLKKVVGY